MEEKALEIEKRLRILERKFGLIASQNVDISFSVEDLLRARGFQTFSFSSEDFINEEQKDTLFSKMQSYHFRRLLADFLSGKFLDRSRVEKALKKWGLEAGKSLEPLKKIGILIEKGEGFQQGVNLNNPGILLQWFVAETIRRELRCETRIDVRISELEKGGDIDLLCALNTNLIMFECKGSPPNNISYSDIKSVLRRRTFLEPDVFILLVDTTLSIDRNILDNLAAITRRVPVRIREGIYRTGLGEYVISAKRNLVKNVLHVLSVNLRQDQLFL